MAKKEVRRKEVEKFVAEKLTNGSVTRSVELSPVQEDIVVETVTEMSKIGHRRLMQRATEVDPNLLAKHRRLEKSFKKNDHPDPTGAADDLIASTLGHVLTRRYWQMLPRESGEGVIVAQRLARQAIGEFRRRRNS